MAKMTRQRQLSQLNPPKRLFEGVTVGTVVDTNDPQQNGRIRVVCPALNDRFDSKINEIPWAMYMSPFGGTTSKGTRGPNDDSTNGKVAYGMWAIPKIGAQAVVMCIDGNPMQRIWIGCLPGQFTNHTLPHGRFFSKSNDLLPSGNPPIGPVSSSEEPIQPLYNNFQEAFKNTSLTVNYEWATRGADYQATAVDAGILHLTSSFLPDDKGVNVGNKFITQGYAESNITSDLGSKSTGLHYDSLVYSLTSPGFHSISMDDRDENCRMRLRTTAGHQIILDDTNERIYISTAKGKNWIEMDQEGNIDIYTDNKVSVHAKKDINLISDETVRLYGAQGIHMYSGGNINIQTQAEFNVLANNNATIYSPNQVKVQSGNNLHIKSGGVMFITSTGDMNLNSSGQILETGSIIHLNGPPAGTATDVVTQPAMLPNKVPQHEPYARVMTANDFTLDPQFSYDDSNVGKVERDGSTIVNITRGKNWRR